MPHHNFPEPKVYTFKLLVLSDSNLKNKDIKFTITQCKERQKLFAFENLKPANVWHFCLRNNN